MNWDAVGAIGELLGAAVVVITVIYLASQVRQNTTASRAEALRSFSIEVSRQFMTMSESERISAIFHKMLYGGAQRSDFSEADMMSASFSVMARLNLYDAAYRSYKEKILTESELKAMLTTRILSMPYTIDSWPIMKQELSPDFVQYLESELPHLSGNRENET
jgi:hypothetical protein